MLADVPMRALPYPSCRNGPWIVVSVDRVARAELVPILVSSQRVHVMCSAQFPFISALMVTSYPS